MKAEARYLDPIQSLEEEKSPKPDIFLSVVIPVSNEQDRIDDTLSTVKDYLQSQDFNSEIIIVDDGNYDRTTEVIKSLDRYVYDFKEQRSTRVKRSIENLGQGFSLSRSILRTRGKYILCTDADLSTPISEVEKLWPHVQSGADIVLTFPKAQADQIRQPMKKKLLGYAVKTVARLPAIDAIRYRQCRFKLLDQASAKSIARAQKLYDRSFEIEQLYLARALGFSIKKVPVEWRPPVKNRPVGQNGNSPNNSIRLLLDILQILYIHRGLKRSFRHVPQMESNRSDGPNGSGESAGSDGTACI